MRSRRECFVMDAALGLGGMRSVGDGSYRWQLRRSRKGH